MKAVANSPSLMELAQPHRGEAVSWSHISVAVIASTEPWMLEAALQAAHAEGRAAYQVGYASLPASAGHLATAIPHAHTTEESEKRLALDLADKAQANLAERIRLGDTPTAEALKALADWLAYTTQVVEDFTEQQTHVAEAPSEAAEVYEARAAVLQTLRELHDPLILSEHIGYDIRRLSRRGRLLSTLTGVLLGALVTLGIGVAADQVRHPKAGPVIEAYLPENLIRSKNAPVIIGGAVAVSALWGLAGAEIGANRRGQFARGRAQKLTKASSPPAAYLVY